MDAISYFDHIQKINPDFSYTGIDVVPFLITSHTERFQNKKKWSFYHIDMTSNSSFFTKPFDLIMTRDVFFHLTFDKIMCALNNLSKSRSKFLLSTTHKGSANSFTSVRSFGMQLNEGGWRDVDLTAYPLSLPEPFYVLDQSMGIWNLPFPLFTVYQNKSLEC